MVCSSIPSGSQKASVCHRNSFSLMTHKINAMEHVEKRFLRLLKGKMILKIESIEDLIIEGYW
jgi:hypothetical protein